MLACLYDVHGNLPALEAVLADAEAAGASQWILGGDYALMGAWPRETVARLRALDGPALWIRGNADRWLEEPPDDPVVQGAVGFCREALGDELAGVLASLPPEGRYGEDTRVCHASPVSDMRPIAPVSAGDDDELLAGIAETRVFCGHIHVQFRREASGVEVINPGSVGIPLDGDHRPGYALVDPDGGVELRRVAYDHTAVVSHLRTLGAPWADLAAARIEQSRFDVGS